MNRCTLEFYEPPTELAYGDEDFVLHTGIYSEQYYNAFNAFYYVYNRDVFSSQIEIAGKFMPTELIDNQCLFNANTGLRCFYGLYVDSFGEFIFDSRYNTRIPMIRATSEAAVWDILVEKMYAFKTFLSINLPMKNEGAPIVVYLPNETERFTFFIDGLNELIQKLKSKSIEGTPNDSITSEMNRMMQTTHAKLRRRVYDMIDKILANKDLMRINESNCYDTAMKILDRMSPKFAEEIREFIRMAEKLDCFIEGIQIVKRDIFRGLLFRWTNAL